MATLDLGKIKQVWRGTYNNSTAYVVDDLVAYTDSGILSTYICVANSTGNAPSSSGTAHASWNYVSKGVADPIPSQSGNSGKVLKTDGSSISWGTDVGGKILQVLSTSSSTTVATSAASSTIADIINLAITPSATSSKILILSTLNVWHDDNGNSYGKAMLFRGASSGTALITGQTGATTAAKSRWGSYGLSFLDSPNTTSATTYQISMQRTSSGTHTLTTNGEVYSLTLMEIAA